MRKFNVGDKAIVVNTGGKYDKTKVKICGIASEHIEFSTYIIELPYVVVGENTHMVLTESCLVRIPSTEPSRRKFYLYNNSPASSKDYRVGFLIGYPIGAEYLTNDKKIVTENFEFAKEFNSFEEALTFNATLPHQCIIFERRDL
jgi:hypothetical protein